MRTRLVLRVPVLGKPLVQLLELSLKVSELFVRKIFQMHEPRPRALDRADQLVELEMDRLRVAVLGALDEKDHEECEDRRAGIDDELSRVGIGEGKGRTPPRPQRSRSR